MGRISIDVRLLVPESVCGDAVTVVCGASPLVQGASMISEGVRLGQREVVVRLSVASDQDVSGVARGVAAHVERAYRWPVGIASKLVVGRLSGMCYLGPGGTASGVAAQQAMTLMGLTGVPLMEQKTLEQLVSSVSSEARLLGVIPIVSSSSGLIDRAAAALLQCGPVEAGGLVDLPIRFDAYAAKTKMPDDHGPIVVYAPPQALAQCARFVTRVGGLTKECESTAAACIEVTHNPRGVALAGFGAGERYGLYAYERDVADLSGAVTRFLVIARRGLFEAAFEASPIYRWLSVVGEDPTADLRSSQGGRYVEIIQGVSGRSLIVSTRQEHDSPGGSAAALGCVPWSPRTPVVRVGPSQ